MKRAKIIATSFILILTLAAIAGTAMYAVNMAKEKGPWGDTTDVLAGSTGRVAHDPLINTEQGNMLVFFFTMGSLTASSIVGYNWRGLFRRRDTINSARKNLGLLAGTLAVLVMIILAVHEGFSGHPIFNQDLGDVVLFIFASSGAVVGFFTGYEFQGYRALRRNASRLT